MTHEPRLTRELRDLLHTQRIAALGTLGDDGAPLVSMVPFAIEPGAGVVVIHVSELAAHTHNLQVSPAVSLLVIRAEQPGEPVHALARVTLNGRAMVQDGDTPEGQACRAAYLARFPEAEPMTELGDFRFVAIEVTTARQVAGFGSARSLDADTIRQVLSDVRG